MGWLGGRMPAWIACRTSGGNSGAVASFWSTSETRTRPAGFSGIHPFTGASRGRRGECEGLTPSAGGLQEPVANRPPPPHCSMFLGERTQPTALLLRFASLSFQELTSPGLHSIFSSSDQSMVHASRSR